MAEIEEGVMTGSKGGKQGEKWDKSRGRSRGRVGLCEWLAHMKALRHTSGDTDKTDRNTEKGSVASANEQVCSALVGRLASTLVTAKSADAKIVSLSYMHGLGDLSRPETGIWDGINKRMRSLLLESSASSIALAKLLSTDAATSSSGSQVSSAYVGKSCVWLVLKLWGEASLR